MLHFERLNRLLFSALGYLAKCKNSPRRIREKNKNAKQIEIKKAARNFHKHYSKRETEEGDRVSDRGKENENRNVRENENQRKEKVRVSETKKREVGEKGLFKGPSSSNVAFIGLLSAKHWSRASR